MQYDNNFVVVALLGMCLAEAMIAAIFCSLSYSFVEPVNPSSKSITTYT